MYHRTHLGIGVFHRCFSRPREGGGRRRRRRQWLRVLSSYKMRREIPLATFPHSRSSRILRTERRRREKNAGRDGDAPERVTTRRRARHVKKKLYIYIYVYVYTHYMRTLPTRLRDDDHTITRRRRRERRRRHRDGAAGRVLCGTDDGSMASGGFPARPLALPPPLPSQPAYPHSRAT